MRVTAAASTGVDGARAWLALRRHCSLRRRALPGGGRTPSMADRLAEHRSLLEDLGAEAETRLGELPDDVRRRAGRSLGLRVAVVGKGGAGKTVISSTLARVLARRGRPVLAADLDLNPGLAMSLGMGPIDAGLPEEAVEEQRGSPYGWQLRGDVDAGQAVDRFSTPGPDGLRYLGLAKIKPVPDRVHRRSLTAVLQVLAGFSRPGWDVVGDMEAGTLSPYEGYHAFADRALVVVGPEWKTLLTARRLLPFLDGYRRTVVSSLDIGPGRDEPGWEPAVRVPLDPEVAEAERAGLAPLDACPGSPVLAAVEELADLLVEDEGERATSALGAGGGGG